MIVSALDIENLVSMKPDAEDLSPNSDVLLSIIYPAKEYLFRDLSTADLCRLLSPSSKSELARSCKARSMPCNIHFERKKTMFGPEGPSGIARHGRKSES